MDLLIHINAFDPFWFGIGVITGAISLFSMAIWAARPKSTPKGK